MGKGSGQRSTYNHGLVEAQATFKISVIKPVLIKWNSFLQIYTANWHDTDDKRGTNLDLRPKFSITSTCDFGQVN